MMKKLLLFAFCAFMISTSTFAWEPVPFTFHIEDPKPLGNGGSRDLINPPVVYIEDYALSFEAGHPDYVLSIKDEDGDVVYSIIVTSSVSQVTLPSSLTGDYMIELTMGYWIFTGWIEL